MRELILIPIFIFVVRTTCAQPIAHQWTVTALNEPLGGRFWIYDIAVDNVGNSYVIGEFENTADFDPGSGVQNLTSLGEKDVFFAKYDLNGDFVFAKQIVGTGDNDHGKAIAVDGNGNIYISGSFESTVDLNPDVGVLNFTSFGSNDIFFAKYSTNGDYLYAKQLGGINNESPADIVVDALKNVYITGTFTGTCDFNPGGSTFNLTSAGESDIFFGKFNTAGNFIYMKQLTGIDEDQSTSIEINSAGEVFLAGSFRKTVDFDPGPGTHNLSVYANDGYLDIFFARYDASGDFIFAKKIGGYSHDEGFSMAIDASDNIYITGYFIGSVDFDPAPTNAEYLSVSAMYDSDLFFAKYNDAGNYIFAKQIGGASYDEGKAIELDASGNIYLTGFFSDGADFDPGSGTQILTSLSSRELFLSKYTSSGNLLFAESMSSSNYSSGAYVNDMVIQGNEVFLAGDFSTGGNSIDFDPGSGSATLTAFLLNGFIAKYNTSGSFNWAKLLGRYKGSAADVATNVITSSNGNSCATGYFKNAIAFPPAGPILISAGNKDIFLTIMDPQGSKLFTSRIGGIDDDEPSGLAYDSLGNIYLTGYFSGTVDFDPGLSINSLTSTGSKDVFFAKYNSNGNLIFAKQLDIESSTHICVDHIGNIYITGQFSGTVDFDPGAAVHNLVSSGGNVFIAKYNSSGNYIYTIQINANRVAPLFIDNENNLLLTGNFSGTVDFDPNAGTQNLTSTFSQSIFFAKYTSIGNFVLAKQIGCTNLLEAKAIVADNFNNIYVTGNFIGIISPDPGAPAHNLTGSGYRNIFISKYDSSGNYKHAFNLGSSGNNIDVNSLITNPNGEIHITGSFYYSCDFDPDTSNQILLSNGVDLYFAKYDSSGKYVYAQQIGGVGPDDGLSISENNSGDVFIAGGFSNTVDFDPGASSNVFTSVNSSDLFIAKYHECTYWYFDADNDGFGNSIDSLQSCVQPVGYVTNHTDCNDADSTMHAMFTFNVDGDGDGYGTTSTQYLCAVNEFIPPLGFSLYNTDCNDADSTVFTEALFFLDSDSDGYGDNSIALYACNQPLGYVTNELDCDDTNPIINPDNPEICNGIDDDCDYQVDEYFSKECLLYMPFHGNANDHSGNANNGTTQNVEYWPDYAETPNDAVRCRLDSAIVFIPVTPFQLSNYTYSARFRLAVTVPNTRKYALLSIGGSTRYQQLLIANDAANGFVGIGFESYGTNGALYYCYSGTLPSVNVWHHVAVTRDNSFLKVYLDGILVCSTATGVAASYSGSPLYATIGSQATPNNKRFPGYLDEVMIHNGALSQIEIQALSNNIGLGVTTPEICNGIDDNCNGIVDEGGNNVFYHDIDNDGYGVTNDTIHACNAPPGYSTAFGDCNDGDAARHPGAIELCNGVDDDCDGLVDEKLPSGLIMHLPMNANANDSTGNGHNGIVSNATLTKDRLGKLNSAYHFDGTSSHINIPFQPDLAQNEMSFAFWLNVGNFNSLVEYLVSYPSYRIEYADTNIFSGTGRRLFTQFNPPGFIGAQAGQYTTPDIHNQWVHVAVARDTTQLKLYFNGNLVFTDNTGYPIVNGGLNDLILGADKAGLIYSKFLEGDLDEVMIFNKKLTASEVSRLAGNYGSMLSTSPEICGNGIDDDCNGQIDEIPFYTYYPDADGDGYGNLSLPLISCDSIPPSGYIIIGTDCNDTNANIHPNLVDECNGIDENCSGLADENCLVKFQYYFDTEPGVGQAGNGGFINVASTDSVRITSSIPTSGLTEGFHTLYIRAQSVNGAWGLWRNYPFAITPPAPVANHTITNAEYYFNTEPGVANAISLPLGVSPADSVRIQSSIATTGLTEGFHTLYIRVKDSENRWGLWRNYPFAITPPAPVTNHIITNAEYYFNTEPGVANAVSLPLGVSPADSVRIQSSIATTGLTEGFHTLYIRVKDSENHWGIWRNYPFAITPPPPVGAMIVDGEAFFDTDPGIGNGIQLWPAVNPGNIVHPIRDVFVPDTLSNGLHYLYFRFKDAAGKWSLHQRASYTVSGTACQHTASISPTDSVLLCTTDSLLITENSMGAFNWQWRKNGVAIPNATSRFYYATENGIYSCNITSSNCNFNSDSLSINTSPSFTWYVDNDGDHYGLTANYIVTCIQPPGFVLDSADCNDANSAIHPFAVEVCNEIDDDCDLAIDDSCVFTLNLKAYIEGYYTGNLTMSSSLYNSGASINILNSDSITLELHESINPYSLILTRNAIINTSGNALFYVPSALLGTSVYVVVKHRSSVETWSKLPVTIGANTNYDFSQ